MILLSTIVLLNINKPPCVERKVGLEKFLLAAHQLFEKSSEISDPGG